jgi:hypothetical protein
VLEFTEHGRLMRQETHAAWQLLHGVLAFGSRYRMDYGAERVEVLDWALAGKPLRGWNLRATDRGVRAEIDPGREGQGHEDQWLAIISQTDASIRRKLVVGGAEYTLYDLLRRSMYDCYDEKETSWTLTALSKYLDPLDQTWTARDGQTWSLERLAAIEAGPLHDEQEAQRHVIEAPCGGTHRMIALAYAYNRYRRDHPDAAPQGGWLATKRRIDWALQAAQENQLPSGAFSILCFYRPMNSASIDEHLASTGHMLEFLSIALPDEQLEAPWVRRGVHYLCDLLERTRHIDLECGALYHAAHGLVMYRERLYGPRGELARRPPDAPAAVRGS